MPVFPDRPAGRVIGGEPKGGHVCHAQPSRPPSFSRSSLRDPIGRPTSCTRLRSVLLIDLSTERLSTLMCLLRVVAFTAMADTEFETIRGLIHGPDLADRPGRAKLLGGLPRWDYSRNWGYGPSGGLGLVLVIVLIRLLMGYIPRGF